MSQSYLPQLLTENKTLHMKAGIKPAYLDSLSNQSLESAHIVNSLMSNGHLVLDLSNQSIALCSIAQQTFIHSEYYLIYNLLWMVTRAPTSCVCPRSPSSGHPVEDGKTPVQPLAERQSSYVPPFHRHLHRKHGVFSFVYCGFNVPWRYATAYSVWEHETQRKPCQHGHRPCWPRKMYPAHTSIMALMYHGGTQRPTQCESMKHKETMLAWPSSMLAQQNVPSTFGATVLGAEVLCIFPHLKVVPPLSWA